MERFILYPLLTVFSFTNYVSIWQHILLHNELEVWRYGLNLNVDKTFTPRSMRYKNALRTLNLGRVFRSLEMEFITLSCYLLFCKPLYLRDLTASSVSFMYSLELIIKKKNTKKVFHWVMRTDLKKWETLANHHHQPSSFRQDCTIIKKPLLFNDNIKDMESNYVQWGGC